MSDLTHEDRARLVIARVQAAIETARGTGEWVDTDLLVVDAVYENATGPDDAVKLLNAVKTELGIEDEESDEPAGTGSPDARQWAALGAGWAVLAMCLFAEVAARLVS